MKFYNNDLKLFGNSLQPQMYIYVRLLKGCFENLNLAENRSRPYALKEY